MNNSPEFSSIVFGETGENRFSLFFLSAVMKLLTPFLLNNSRLTSHNKHNFSRWHGNENCGSIWMLAIAGYIIQVRNLTTSF